MINEKHLREIDRDLATRSGIPNRKFECTIINRKCLLRGGAFSHE